MLTVTLDGNCNCNLFAVLTKARIYKLQWCNITNLCRYREGDGC